MKSSFYLKIIPAEEKKRFFIILLLIILSSVFEIASIYLLTGLIVENKLIKNEIFSYQQYTAFVFFIIIFKSAFNLYTLNKLNLFMHDIQTKVGEKLLQKYLNMSYSNYVKKDTSLFLNNLNSSVSDLVNYFLSPLFIVLSEGIIGFLVICYLLYYQFTLTALAIGLTIFGFFIYRIIPKENKKYGQVKHEFEVQKIKNIKEAFSLFKEIKIYQLQDYFIEKNNKISKSITLVSLKHQFSQGLTRVYVELFFVAFIIVVINYALIVSDNSIELMTVYGFSLMRLLPITSRIMVALQNLKYSIPVTKNIFFDVEKNNNTNYIQKKIISNNEQVTIRVDNLSYKRSDNYIFKKLSFDLKESDNLVLITGKSGSGKSTLIDLLNGFINSYEGEVRINGFKITSEYNLSNFSSYVGQNYYIVNDTIKKNIIFSSDFCENLYKKCIYASCSDEFIFEKGENFIVGEHGIFLSGGQRQRLAIARALYKNKKIVLLDEATSALDKVNELKILGRIRECFPHIQILFITHSELKFENMASKIINLEVANE